MKTNFKVEGFKEMEAALMDLPKSTAKAVVRKVLKRVAVPVEGAMKAGAARRTGALQESIAISTRLDKRQKKLERRTKKSAVQMYIGPSYNLGDGGRHGHLVEFGTEKMAAQPFMRPAWNGSKNQVLEDIMTEMWAEIEKSIARHQRRMAKKARR